MEGTFDFDPDGLARALAAPRWTLDALSSIQGDLAALSGVLADERLRPEVTEAWIDRVVERIVEKAGPEIAAQVAAGVKGKPNSAALKFVKGLTAVVGGMMTYVGAEQWGYPLVHGLVVKFPRTPLIRASYRFIIRHQRGLAAYGVITIFAQILGLAFGAICGVVTALTGH